METVERVARCRAEVRRLRERLPEARDRRTAWRQLAMWQEHVRWLLDGGVDTW